MSGFFKIGKAKNLEQRVRTLNKETGIPSPFEIEFKIWADNALELELLVHASLHKYRVDVMKEFFIINRETAIRKLKEWAEKLRKDPYYFKVRFPNYGQQWNDVAAINVIKLYKIHANIQQTSFWCGKTPYEVEAFLNRIGLIQTTQFPNSVPVYSGYKKGCYHSGKLTTEIDSEVSIQTISNYHK